jgi:hypothetical protein
LPALCNKQCGSSARFMGSAVLLAMQQRGRCSLHVRSHLLALAGTGAVQQIETNVTECATVCRRKEASLLPSTNSEPFTPGIHAKREIARPKKKKRGYRVCSLHGPRFEQARGASPPTTCSVVVASTCHDNRLFAECSCGTRSK